MKTTANVQKTNLKSAFFAASLIVIGFSVDGQGATKPDLTIDNNTQFAFANTKIVPAAATSTTTKATASFSAFLATETEEALAIEDWMTEESNSEVLGAFAEPATEEELTLEAWMTEESNFGVTFTTEAEEELTLESWMTKELNTSSEEKKQTNEKIYIIETDNATYVVREFLETEKELKIESWMINSQLWK